MNPYQVFDSVVFFWQTPCVQIGLRMDHSTCAADVLSEWRSSEVRSTGVQGGRLGQGGDGFASIGSSGRRVGNLFGLR
jgi:hypothetical protein